MDHHTKRVTLLWVRLGLGEQPFSLGYDWRVIGGHNPTQTYYVFPTTCVSYENGYSPRPNRTPKGVRSFGVVIRVNQA